MTILEQENSEYIALLELSMQKTPVIIEGNIKKLQEITDEEQNVIGRINHLEKKREETVNDIAGVLNKDVKTLSLSNLIQMLGNRPEEQKKLALLHDELKTNLGNMVRVNDQNRELIANALEMVEFDLNLIQSMKAAPETANYNKGAFNTGNSFGVQVGSFDAKQ